MTACTMHLLFDLDGTLTDPGDGIVACLRQAFETLGIPAPPESELLTFIGPPLQESFLKVLGTAQKADEALRVYRERYSTLGMFENVVYPGIDGVLTTLGALGFPLLVATSKPEVFATKILQHFGLARHFKAIYGAALSGERSKKADLLTHIVQQQGLDPRSAIMIGDRSHDILAGQGLGMKTIGVLWGYGSRDELVESGADVIVETVSALVVEVEHLTKQTQLADEIGGCRSKMQ